MRDNRTMRLHDARMINDIVDLCRIIPPNSIGVEIGCFQGESSELFAKSGKFDKLYCVDPWQPGYYKGHDMYQIERQFDERTSVYPCIEKFKGTFDEFLMYIAVRDMNFVYIDGNHKYDFVKSDIKNALSVLPTGGILSGHDYKFIKSPGVEIAVKELLGYPDIRFAGYSWAKIIR